MTDLGYSFLIFYYLVEKLKGRLKISFQTAFDLSRSALLDAVFNDFPQGGQLSAADW